MNSSSDRRNEEIQNAAYAIWETRVRNGPYRLFSMSPGNNGWVERRLRSGSVPGDEMSDWLAAERLVAAASPEPPVPLKPVSYRVRARPTGIGK